MTSLAFGLALLAFYASAEVQTPLTASLDDESVEELVRQLGSDRFDLRELASRRLMSIPEADAALRAAEKSADPEVARRATLILKEQARRRAQNALKRLQVYAHAGRLDLLATEFAAWDHGYYETECWNLVAQVAKQLVVWEKKTHHKIALPCYPESPFSDFQQYLETARPGRVVNRRGILTRGGAQLSRGVDMRICANIAGSILVSGEGIRFLGPQVHGIVSSILIAGDSVDLGVITSSVVVCDGDLFVRTTAVKSIILASGRVQCDGAHTECLIISGGTIQPSDVGSIVKERASLAPAGIRFFALSDLGLETEDKADGVHVKSVKAGCALAGAGLQAGDVILAVNDTSINSSDTARRCLRRGYCAKGETTLTLRRGKRTEKVQLRLKDIPLLDGPVASPN